MAVTLTPLAPGTEVAAIGTGYRGEIVTSEVAPSKITKEGVLVSVVRWTESIPLAGVIKGETTIWSYRPGRAPRFIVTAQD